MKQRFVTLLTELNQGLYEKETELSLSLLAALAGESILLLGPPGVAKSMIARRLKQAFQHARAFEYLMSRFSTPDEIFGPVSISLLKESDTYQRNVKGYLPDCEVVFLDEIWKAGPAIQNSLLTVMNEKLYRNGDHELHIPLKLLIGASNELPTEGEGLEALWDRFLVRLVSTCITREEVFYQMLLDQEENPREVNVSQPVTPQEYAGWQEEIRQIGCNPAVLQCISRIRKGLKQIPVASTNLDHDVYVSDRRWKKIIHLLKASAFIHDRSQIEPADLFPAWHCLWNEPVEQEEVRKLVIKSLFAQYIQAYDELRLAVTEDLKLTGVRACLERARRNNDHRDDSLVLFDQCYYHLLNHGVGNTYIFMVDFHEMKDYRRTDPPLPGILYKDPANPKRTLVRVDNGQDTSRIEVIDKVNLYRINRNLYINGVPYAMEERGYHQSSHVGTAEKVPLPSSRNYEEEVEQFIQDLGTFSFSLKDNIFLNPHDRKDIDSLCADLRRQTALLRVDIEKLRYPG